MTPVRRGNLSRSLSEAFLETGASVNRLQHNHNLTKPLMILQFDERESLCVRSLFYGSAHFKHFKPRMIKSFIFHKSFWSDAKSLITLFTDACLFICVSVCQLPILSVNYYSYSKRLTIWWKLSVFIYKS